MSALEETKEIPFDFEEDTQKEMASCIMTDTNFMKRCNHLLKSEYFANEMEAIFVDQAILFYTKYGECPNNIAWVQILKDLVTAGRVRDKDSAKDKLRELLTLKVRSKTWLLDKIAEFVKQRAVLNAYLSSAKLLAKTSDLTRFDKAEKLITSAFQTALAEESPDYDYFAEIEVRTEYRRAVASGVIKRDGIPTGVPELDSVLYHQGWGKEELSVLMGGAKASKSFHLTFFAANAVKAGKNVLFITLENSIQVTATRLDAYLSHIGIDEQFARPEMMGLGVEKLRDDTARGQFKIRAFPTGTLSPSHLQKIVEDYKADGLTFDMIVIDYLDIMTSSIRTTDVIERSNSIWVEVRAIAQAEKLAVLSATQSNREGMRSVTLEMEHVSTDINRVRNADLVLAISRTKEERAEGKARITFAAARNNSDAFTLFVKQDLNHGNPIAEVEEVE